jgi:hypothetical protein
LHGHHSLAIVVMPAACMLACHPTVFALLFYTLLTMSGSFLLQGHCEAH